MAKFILLYKGPARAPQDIPEAEMEQIMQAWTQWGDKVGSSLVDFGNPFAGRASVHGDGSEGAASDYNGYTIVEASDLEAAKGHCDHHPFLSDSGREFSVEVYELAPM
jgi:hypothetical protein